MPAYNESDHIYRNIKETWKVFSKTKCSFEIVVVDDGSTDGTRAPGRLYLSPAHITRLASQGIGFDISALW